MTKKEQTNILTGWLGLHKGLIFKIVRTYAFTAMDREDLFQEIVIQVWRSIPGFRHESAVTTWLYRIALNTAIKSMRKERKQEATSINDATYILCDNTVQMDDRLTWLYEEIYRLDKIDRSIALLLLDGFSYKEMSGMLGITESNVGVKISRIKKQLITKSKKI